MRLLRACRLLVWFRRFFATGAAAWVLALGVAGANPSLHAQIHEPAGHAAKHDHSAPAESCGSLCAILLVAAGIEPASAVSLVLPDNSSEVASWTPPGDPDVAAVRYLRHPERGPPQG